MFDMMQLLLWDGLTTCSMGRLTLFSLLICLRFLHYSSLDILVLYSKRKIILTSPLQENVRACQIRHFPLEQIYLIRNDESLNSKITPADLCQTAELGNTIVGNLAFKI